MKHYLFINGGSTVAFDAEKHVWYVLDTLLGGEWEILIPTTKRCLKRILLTKLSWVSTSWDKQLVNEYKQLLKELGV